MKRIGYRWRALAVGALVVGLAAVHPAGVRADTLCGDGMAQQSGTTITCTFSYTGGEQQFPVPVGVTSLHIEAIGGMGGIATDQGFQPIPTAGRGAEVEGDILGATGTLYVEVGGNAANGFEGGPAGFNGGGSAKGGGSGGGASDVRTLPMADSGTLASRLIVAGGGGGTGRGGGANGGSGGDAGLNGQPGTGATGADSTTAGGGATQSAGGAAGLVGANFTSGDPGEMGSLGQGASGGGLAGGGGGGGNYGGGSGSDGYNVSTGIIGSGGGGGSSLVPVGGSASVDTAGTPKVVIIYTDADLGLTGVPANITTNATSPSGAVVTYTPPTATDEDGTTPTVSCDLASGSSFPIGTTKVTCSATDSDDSNSPVSASFTVTVNDTDLALSPATLPNITVNAANPAGAVVTYTPPTAIDEAGDSPAPTVVCTPTSGSTFPIGTTTVTCTATDSDDTNSPVSASFTVTVKDALTVSGMSVSATEGSLFSGVVATGTAYGTSNPLTANITWGDGSSSTVSVTPNAMGSYSVAASHLYAEEGPDTITVAVSDGSGLHASTTSPATVSDAALTLTGFAAGSVDGLRAGLAATFTDGDPAGQVSDYQAVITWGDGATSTVPVVKNPFGKGFALAGLHSYARKGTYQVTLTITDHGGSHSTHMVSVIVKNGSGER